MINVSREPQNRSLLYVNEDLRIALILLKAQKNHYVAESCNLMPKAGAKYVKKIISRSSSAPSYRVFRK
jgi:hypothetical protein